MNDTPDPEAGQGKRTEIERHLTWIGDNLNGAEATYRECRAVDVARRAVPSTTFIYSDPYDAGLYEYIAEQQRRGLAIFPGLNTVQAGWKGFAKDDHITRRWHIVIDVDRTIKEPNTNATDEEKALIWKDIQPIIAFLNKYGTKPLIVDSSNGYHLWLKIDLPPNDMRVEQFLRQLSEEFSTEHAEVDTSVHNASRISKLAGTYASKSPTPTIERPGRYAFIVEWNDPRNAFVSPDTLNEMIAALPSLPVATKRATIVRKSKVAKIKRDDSEPQTPYQFPTIDESIWPWNERIRRAIEYVNDGIREDISRSGKHGHNTCYKHFRACLWGFALHTPEQAQIFANNYNDRLTILDKEKPGMGYQPWTQSELQH